MKLTTKGIQPRQFRLRRVDETDPKVWSLIVSMDSRCFTKVDAPALSSNEGAWWIAYSGGVPAGYCGVKNANFLADGVGGAYLNRSGVLPEFRGCGLQKKMIQKRLSYARDEGFKFALSDTTDNPASANSLIACGFKMFQPNYPYSFTYSCYWKKIVLHQAK